VRTTLNIDDDILAIARAHAEREQRSIGAVLSDMARRSLAAGKERVGALGLPLLPARPEARVVTPEHVRALMDELP
jgi:hypothetical protein